MEVSGQFPIQISAWSGNAHIHPRIRVKTDGFLEVVTRIIINMLTEIGNPNDQPTRSQFTNRI